jgi:hypothetical protein
MVTFTARAARTRHRVLTFPVGLAAIAGAGFVVRVIYLFTLSPPIAGIGDSAYYYTSNLIVQGQGYTEPYRLMFHNQLVPTALHPPLWPALLSLVSLFTAPASGVGDFGGAALALHRILGCVVAPSSSSSSACLGGASEARGLGCLRARSPHCIRAS